MKQNCQESTKNILVLISYYRKIAGCKVKKSITFLYTSNERAEFEIKNSIIYVSIKNKIPGHKFNAIYIRSIWEKL